MPGSIGGSAGMVAGDSLWAQSIRPILDGREMAAQTAHVAGLIRDDREMSCRYKGTFGAPPSPDDEAVLVDVAKALASFQETLVAGRTSFDAFRDALANDDREAMARYPVAAQRGLQLFVGRGNCSLCHFGPNFTNGEFHDIGIPFFAEAGRVDFRVASTASAVCRPARSIVSGATATTPRKRSRWRRVT